MGKVVVARVKVVAAKVGGAAAVKMATAAA
jgi:hypothetical protein